MAKRVNVLDWPRQLPDLNPNELVFPKKLKASSSQNKEEQKMPGVNTWENCVGVQNNQKIGKIKKNCVSLNANGMLYI